MMADTSAFFLCNSLYAYSVCFLSPMKNELLTTSTTIPQNVDLRDQIISVQEEKKTLTIELENLKSNFAEVSIMAGQQRAGGLDFVSSFDLLYGPQYEMN